MTTDYTESKSRKLIFRLPKSRSLNIRCHSSDTKRNRPAKDTRRPLVHRLQTMYRNLLTHVGSRKNSAKHPDYASTHTPTESAIPQDPPQLTYVPMFSHSSLESCPLPMYSPQNRPFSHFFGDLEQVDELDEKTHLDELEEEDELEEDELEEDELEEDELEEKRTKITPTHSHLLTISTTPFSSFSSLHTQSLPDLIFVEKSQPSSGPLDPALVWRALEKNPCPTVPRSYTPEIDLLQKTDSHSSLSFHARSALGRIQSVQRREQKVLEAWQNNTAHILHPTYS
ncbi:hypothetical protein BDF14DRAFT_1347107 [Spinellus fusiger]|nr:hypothetical protein BDF14DRAFT_1347107 [Spinellus fusiger]